MKAISFSWPGRAPASAARPWPPGLLRLLGVVLAGLLMWLAATAAHAQAPRPVRVLTARYWFDGGAKTTMTAADGAFDEALETALANATPGLSVGEHTLNIELQGEDGQYGPVATSALTVVAPQLARTVRILSGEVQLGAGAPVAVVAEDGAFDEAVEEVIKSALASGAVIGPLALTIRLRGEDGQFGPDFTSVLTVITPLTARTVRIQSGEVQLGAGASVPVVATDGSFDEAVEEVLRAALASGVVAGPLALRIRLRGEDGQFGPDFTSVLTVITPLTARTVRITSGEVQLGAGAPVPVVAIDGAFDAAVEAVVRGALASGVVPGPLALRMRLMGEDGQFGPYFTSVLTVIAPLTARAVRITSGEVQLGASAPVPVIALDGSFDEAVEEVVRAALAAGMTVGPQTLRVRLMGDDGQFGPYFTSVLSVVAPMTARLVRIQEGRVWWDADLAGAVPMTIVNGALNPAVATALGVRPTGSLAPGVHAVRVQLKGDDGEWANTFSRVVNVTPCTAPGTPVASATATVITVGQTISLSATVVAGATYEWRGPNGFTSTLRQPSITNAQVTASGTYWVKALGPGPDFCPSPEDSVNVTVLPPVTITTDAVAPVSLCAGVSFSVGYSVTSGTLNAGNQYRVQLSDASGDFTAATIIGGPVTSVAASGSIPVTIPAGTATGTQYRIRVVASNPATNGANNGSALTITTPFTVVATATPNPVAQGGTVTFGVTGAPTGATYAWTGPGTLTSTTIAGPNLNNVQPANVGTYQVTVTKGGCQSVSSVTVSLLPVITTGTVSPATYCSGGSITVPFTVANGPLPAGNTFTAQLLDSLGTVLGTIGTQGGTTSGSLMGTIPAGLPYSLRNRIRMTSSFPATTGPVSTQDITVINLSGAVASSNSPVAAGGTITLSASGTPAASLNTYTWGGPNGFTANGATVTISGATPAMSGTYQVSVQRNGCTAVRTVNVTVTPGPTTISTGTISPTTYCAGGTISVPFTVGGSGFNAGNVFTAQLVDSLGTVLGTIGTLTSTTAGTINGTIPAGAPYALTDRVRVAGSNPATIGSLNGQNLTVIQLSGATATSNSPITAGATLNLNVSGVAAATLNAYAWTGPNGFSSSLRNPSIAGATPAASGTYQVGISRNGCSVTRTVNVTVNPGYTITVDAFTPTTICAGEPIALNFTTTGAYVSPAPFVAGNTFTAYLVNATTSAIIGTIGSLNNGGSITNRVLNGTWPATAAAGTYRIRIDADQPGTTGTVSSFTVNLTNVAIAVASSNSPVALGATLILSVTGAPAGSTFAWTGPGTISGAATPNASVTNLQPANEGTYQVVVSNNGCSVTKTVNVLLTTAVYTDALAGTAFCAGSAISIAFRSTGTYVPPAPFVAGNTFTAHLVNPSTGAVLGTIGSLNQGGRIFNRTINGSWPAGIGTGPFRVRVDSDQPGVTGSNNGTNITLTDVVSAVASSNSPVAAGGTITLGVTGAPTGATFAWTGPVGTTIGGAATASASVANAQVGNSGTYSVVISLNGCSTTKNLNVTVNPGASVITTGTISPTTYCVGGAISVPFTVGGGAFNAGNVFTAQLLDSLGTVIGSIGTLTGISGGTINGNIPTGAPYSLADRIRVVGSSPATVGSVSGQNLTIIQLGGATAASNSPITVGATLNFDVTGVPAASLNTYVWSKISGGGTFSSSLRNPSIAGATVANSGTYQVVVSRGSCSVTRTVSVTVNPATAITQVGTINPATTCPGNSVSVQFFVSGTFDPGNVFTAQLIDSLGNVVGNIGTAGTVGGMTSGQTSGAYPVGAAYGENYRIRVVSSNPALVSPLSSGVVRVYNLNPATAVSNSPVALNGTIQLGVATVGFASSNTYQWTKISGGGTFNSTLQNPQIMNATTTNAGTYQVVISRGVCSVTRTVAVTVSGVPTIATGPISPLSYCAGATVSIPFTVTGGAFSAGNIFTAELSGTGGLFTAGTTTVLGTLSSTTSGTITGIIPTTNVIQSSSTYRIRVIASAPVQTGTDNGADIRITNLELATAQTNAPIVAGNTLSISVFGASGTYAWTGPAGTTITNANTSSASVLNAQVSNSGTYQVVITSNGCSVTRTVSVTVNPGAPTASITTTGPTSGTYCAGSPIFVDFTTTGTFAANNVFTAQLSNASGSFASPITIGTVNGPGTGSGQIGGPIPAGTPTGTGYLVRIISSNPGLTGTTSGPLTISGTSFTWVGTANSNWNDPQNWSCGVVPGQNDDVTINPGGNSPIVGIGGGIVRSITINLNATITVNSTFTVWGNVVNNGTIGAGSGSGWVWAGGGNWTVGGTGTYNFWNVTVNNTVNLTVNSTWTVRGNVLNNGGLVQGYQYFLYLPGTSSFGGNPMTWGTYYVQPGGSVNWSAGFAGITAWGIYNGGSINPGTSGFTFGAGGGTAGSIGGVGSNVIPFYNVTFNNPAGVNQLSDLSIANFWTNNFVFNPGTRQVRFTGSANITGINVVFYDLVIDVTANVTLDANIIIRGDLINNGLFNCGIRGVIFDGTNQLIGGSAVTNFFNVTFNNTVNLTLNQNIIVDGNWLNGGNFAGLGYYVLFSGTSGQTVGGAGSTRFGDVRWNNVSAGGVSLGGPIRVAGNFSYLGGLWNAGGFGVTFDGTTTQAINGPNVPIFAGLVNNNTSVTGLTLGVNVRGTDTWSGTGRYCGCGFETWFSGVAQTIGGPGRWDFHHVRITSSTSLTLNVNIHVYGDWFLNGVFVPGLFTVFFDGIGGQLIGGPVVTNFYHLTINNVVNVTLNQTIRVRGNFAGPGRFIGDGFFTIFDGSAAQTIFTGAGTRFGHLTFANAAGVTYGSNVGLTGNFLNTAGFGAGGFTTGFYGAGIQTISGGGIVFGNAYTAPGATASLNVPVGFTGGLTNDGAWLANLHACTFSGTGTIDGLNIPLFYHLYINGTVTLAVNVNLTGDIRINGVFLPVTYGCIFGGTVPQRIYGTAVIFNFYDLTVNLNAVVNVEVDIHIRHDLLNNGTINWPTCRVVFFDGSTLQTIGGGTVTRFCGLTINNPGGTVRLGSNIRCAGDFRDQGGWRAGGFLTTFDGSAAQGIYGLAGGGTLFGGVTFNNASGGGATLFGPIGLTGDFRNTAGFNAGGFGVTFGGTSGTQNVYGPAQVVFHHLIIDVAATVQLNLDIRLTGNWTNRNVAVGGGFLPNGWRVWFIGTVAQTINGPAVTNFYHITINNTVSVSLTANIRIRGNFLDNGVFCGCGFLTTFDGVAPQTIACNSGNTRFHDITFANNTGVTLINAIGVTGNWLNNGGFNAGGQLVLFAGTGGQTIGGSALTTFHDWRNTNNSTAGVSLIRDAAWTGNWTNDGRYCGCGFLSSFVGTTPQVITCNTLQSAFHHIILSNTSTGGVRLAGDIGVTGNWHVTGLFFPATFTVHFTGTVVQTITRGGLMLHCQFYGIRITNTVGVNLGANCPLYYAGPFTNNGGFGYNGNGVWANGGTGGNGSGGNGAGGHLGGGGAAGGGGGNGGGGAAQACGGSAPTTFGDWTMQNPNGATCAGPGGFNVQQVLTMAPGSGNLACGNAVTLLSNATGTGMIVNTPTGGVCTGLGSMVRYVNSGPTAAPGYRHYSTPMRAGTSTVNEFADDLPSFILNQAYNTAPVPNAVTPFPTLFQYDETRIPVATPVFDRGWMVPAGASAPMIPGKGYSAQTNANTVVDITGTFQNGDVTTPTLSRGALTASGWNLVGNPYPAPMDWRLVTKPATVNNALYIHKPTGRYTGTFASWVNGVAQNGGDPVLTSMQGFFVRVNAPGTTALTFTNAARATVWTNPTFWRPAATSAETRPLLRLVVTAPATGKADETVLYFEQGATRAFDRDFDAGKPLLSGGGYPTVWSSNGTESFAISGLPEADLTNGTVIPLAVRVPADGQYVLSARQLLNLPAGAPVWLEDRQLGTVTNLATDSLYAFSMLAANTTPRFFLNVGRGMPTGLTTALDLSAARLAVYPNPAQADVTVRLEGLPATTGALQAELIDALGRTLLTATLRPELGTAEQTLDVRALPQGVYTLRLKPTATPTATGWTRKVVIGR